MRSFAFSFVLRLLIKVQVALMCLFRMFCLAVN